MPERVELKAEPIDLAPLGPFLGPEAGLQAGTLQADWTAQLGAAVPGGTGPTSLKGGLRAQGLRFAGAEGGKALDVVLDTDVTGDMNTGDLSLETLRLELGPARITGKGQVKGLLTETPAVQDFELVGQNLDPAVLAEYYPPLRKQLANQVAGPIGLVVRGGGTQESQALTAEVDLTPVRLRIPEQLSKEAGAPMRLTARLTGAAASGGALRFDAKTDLTGVDMRPGLLLDKRPGQTLPRGHRGHVPAGEGQAAHEGGPEPPERGAARVHPGGHGVVLAGGPGREADDDVRPGARRAPGSTRTSC